MICPNCNKKLPKRFASATGFKSKPCPECKIKIIPSVASLKKVSKTTGSIGFFLGTPFGAFCMLLWLNTGQVFLPVFIFSLVFIGVTYSSYSFAKSHLEFEIEKKTN